MLSGGRIAGLTLRVLVVLATIHSATLLFRYFLGTDVRRHHVEASLFILALAALACWRARPPAAGTPSIQPERWMVAGIALAAAAFALNWPVLSIGLLSDDFVLLEWAARGDVAPRQHEFVRPVPLFLWWVMLAFGAGPAVLHGVNVTLHAANTLLTVRLGRTVGLGVWNARAAGLVFLVWPTQVEAVAWASGIFDLLMTAAVLGTVLLYSKSVGHFTWARIAALVTIASAGCLSKETAVAIPLLIAIVSIARWSRVPPARDELYALSILIVVCAGYLVWRVFIHEGATAGLPALSRYVIKEQISRTFGALAVPFTAERIARAPWVAAGWASGLVGLLVLPVAIRRTRTAGDGRVAAGLAWCIAATAPAVGYLFIGPYLEGTRYAYLAAAGWAVALSARLDFAGRPRWMASSAAVIGAVVCVAQGQALLDDWRHAARERDRILAHAREAASGCALPSFTGLPDRYRGAQLFRNGFPEALGRTAADGASGRDASCAFEWDGAAFRRR